MLMFLPGNIGPGTDMQVAKRGITAVLRLDHGEDVLESILKGAEDDGSTKIITAGLGMISDFELGYFDNGKYITRSFAEAHELLSMQGSVASEGDPRLHIHVAVADKSHAAFGGHLLRGKAWMSNEICLLSVDGLGSSRQMDPVKKVGILQLET
jgi:predicted DNA-binding protein with PD1-like motif